MLLEFFILNKLQIAAAPLPALPVDSYYYYASGSTLGRSLHYFLCCNVLSLSLSVSLAFFII